MNKEILSQFLIAKLPQSQEFASLHASTDSQVTFILHPKSSHLRPGNTIAGPVMMALADLAAYGCVLNTCTKNTLAAMEQAVTTSFNINFIHRPNANEPLYARAKLLKLGKRLAVCDISIDQSESGDKSETKLVAHCTCTYALPPTPAEQTVQS